MVKFAYFGAFSYYCIIVIKEAFMKELIEKITSLQEKIFRTWGYL